MAQEIEAKFLDIDIESMRQKLRSADGVLKLPMRLMRRDQFDHADNRYGKSHYQERLRIRDEGNKCTMTYKKSLAHSNYPLETETVIGSYEDTKKLLIAIGLHSFSYQESRRETWQIGDVEVVIDEWPWLRPYIEIEGPSESSIKVVATTLGFDWTKAGYGSVNTAYMAQYPQMTVNDSIGDVAIVRFEDPMPQYLKERM